MDEDDRNNLREKKGRSSLDESTSEESTEIEEDKTSPSEESIMNSSKSTNNEEEGRSSLDESASEESTEAEEEETSLSDESNTNSSKVTNDEEEGRSSLDESASEESTKAEEEETSLSDESNTNSSKVTNDEEEGRSSLDESASEESTEAEEEETSLSDESNTNSSKVTNDEDEDRSSLDNSYSEALSNSIELPWIPTNPRIINLSFNQKINVSSTGEVSLLHTFKFNQQTRIISPNNEEGHDEININNMTCSDVIETTEMVNKAEVTYSQNEDTVIPETDESIIDTSYSASEEENRSSLDESISCPAREIDEDRPLKRRRTH